MRGCWASLPSVLPGTLVKSLQRAPRNSRTQTVLPGGRCAPPFVAIPAFSVGNGVASEAGGGCRNPEWRERGAWRGRLRRRRPAEGGRCAASTSPRRAATDRSPWWRAGSAGWMPQGDHAAAPSGAPPARRGPAGRCHRPAPPPTRHPLVEHLKRCTALLFSCRPGTHSIWGMVRSGSSTWSRDPKGGRAMCIYSIRCLIGYRGRHVHRFSSLLALCGSRRPWLAQQKTQDVPSRIRTAHVSAVRLSRSSVFHSCSRHSTRNVGCDAYGDEVRPPEGLRTNVDPAAGRRLPGI